MKQKQKTRVSIHPLQIGKKILTKNYKFFQKHPIYTALSLITLYFIYDIYLLNLYNDSATKLAWLGLALVYVIFYVYYIHGYVVNCLPKRRRDQPEDWKHPRRNVLIGYVLLIIITLVGAISYPYWIKAFPGVESAYYPSQVILLVLIAPIMEELCFRYFLYDRWARLRFGVWKGILLTGFLFVICHPVSDLRGVLLYWAPTICFYFVYDSFGLYGSIAAHMIFNFIAL